MKKVIFSTLLIISTAAYSQSKLPGIALNTMKNIRVDVRELSNSEGLKVFSFWATWCAPCIEELDAISEDYEDWVNQTGVEVIAVVTDNARTQKRVVPLVRGKAWQYKVLYDTNQELKQALNISNIPHTIIVKDGEIIYEQSGYSPGYEDVLLEKLIFYMD